MTTYRAEGDALLAERIAVQARDIDPIRVKKGSHTHRIQVTTLRDSAFCVIEKPLRIVVKKTSK